MTKQRLVGPPEQIPLLREMQDDIAALRREISRIQKESVSDNKAQNATLKALSNLDVTGVVEEVVGEALDTAEFDMAQVPTGDLSQARVTGTWTKDVDGGTATFSGPIFTPYGRANVVTTSWSAAYLNSDGRIGIASSSADMKQDVEPVDMSAMVDAILTLGLIQFRYIAAVDELGDEASVEVGSIAQYLANTPLAPYVYNDTEGNPLGINYERLTIPLIATVQALSARIGHLEAQLNSES